MAGKYPIIGGTADPSGSLPRGADTGSAAGGTDGSVSVQLPNGTTLTFSGEATTSLIDRLFDEMGQGGLAASIGVTGPEDPSAGAASPDVDGQATDAAQAGDDGPVTDAEAGDGGPGATASGTAPDASRPDADQTDAPPSDASDAAPPSADVQADPPVAGRTGTNAPPRVSIEKGIRRSRGILSDDTDALTDAAVILACAVLGHTKARLDANKDAIYSVEHANNAKANDKAAGHEQDMRFLTDVVDRINMAIDAFRKKNPKQAGGSGKAEARETPEWTYDGQAWIIGGTGNLPPGTKDDPNPKRFVASPIETFEAKQLFQVIVAREYTYVKTGSGTGASAYEKVPNYVLQKGADGKPYIVGSLGELLVQVGDKFQVVGADGKPVQVVENGQTTSKLGTPARRPLGYQGRGAYTGFVPGQRGSQSDLFCTYRHVMPTTEMRWIPSNIGAVFPPRENRVKGRSESLYLIQQASPLALEAPRAPIDRRTHLIFDEMRLLVSNDAARLADDAMFWGMMFSYNDEISNLSRRDGMYLQDLDQARPATFYDMSDKAKWDDYAKANVYGYTHGLVQAIYKVAERTSSGVKGVEVPYEVAVGEQTYKLASCFCCAVFMEKTGDAMVKMGAKARTFEASATHLDSSNSWAPLYPKPTMKTGATVNAPGNLNPPDPNTNQNKAIVECNRLWANYCEAIIKTGIPILSLSLKDDGTGNAIRSLQALETYSSQLTTATDKASDKVHTPEIYGHANLILDAVTNQISVVKQIAKVLEAPGAQR